VEKVLFHRNNTKRLRSEKAQYIVSNVPIYTTCSLPMMILQYPKDSSSDKLNSPQLTKRMPDRV